MKVETPNFKELDRNSGTMKKKDINTAHIEETDIGEPQ